ncbi:PREDICTED: ankyrin repeat and zinc finger domain-containing protein 1 isoform X2 [Nelumbo nucifera]|uniref:Ankyrin repeat and zinc finger domain-containing protein 1 isoform X2 n=2 Tax=Nelumbo nucifera TaxID=4432 RepID=A0A1U8B8M7_NELNU|nr:PREDICTED: ankyrin repeat and zinc finger domain-containing protein 1 isoform X2 [Nelumbo nucifera]DAD18639.1 TPA_asm: hypothetical protein HUJ06_020102 [Nelumbo nucifera]
MDLQYLQSRIRVPSRPALAFQIRHPQVKLSIAGKNTIKEEDFDELTSDSLFKDSDISSISGSEDEAEKDFCPNNDLHKKGGDSSKQKLFINLQTGETVSIWKCLLLAESETISFHGDKLVPVEKGCNLRENELVERLKNLTHEPRDKTHLRIVLLASGGHFAGCVFDGNSVVDHKTFHRYVIRAKAGKKQSSKDASGKAAHSAGASLRRYNELALKKEIQELLDAWKRYFDASSCIFIYAPSGNSQLFFNGEKALFTHQQLVVRHIPLTVRRPTFKEAKRIYNHLTHLTYEMDEKGCPPSIKVASASCAVNMQNSHLDSNEEKLVDYFERKETTVVCSDLKSYDALPLSSESKSVGVTTPLHEAAMSGNAHKTLELLEQGLDPSIKDERGRTPYMLATEKEVRNIFRRFMALNIDKWDWHSAKVPSALTKEMEESQAAKQAEKDAKRKAKSKELKKLRRAKEKKAQAQAALSEKVPTVSQSQGASSTSIVKSWPQSSSSAPSMSKEEELKRAIDIEREKRAAAAERRIAAALNAQPGNTTVALVPSSSQPKSGVAGDISCSYCNISLAGKVPFHRYHYKYCSTTCMHAHREILEAG